MRTRGLFLSVIAGLLLVALVVPAWGDVTVEVVSGNPHCVHPEGIGSTAEFQFKVENPARGTTTYQAPDGGQFTVAISGNRRDVTSVVSNRTISEIIVKGGPVGANVYSYSPAVSSASGLTTPGPHAINHIVFCYDDGFSLSGTKFGDANFNGIKDASEAGLAGWTINVYDAEVLVASTTTGTGGTYSFSLPPGHYLVCEEAQSGWAQTAPDNPECEDAEIAGVEPGGHTVDLTASLSSGNDFGNAETESLVCEGEAGQISADPQYTLILRGCEGSKEFFFSAGLDTNGDPFVNLMPLPGQDEAQFLEELVFSADPDVTQDSRLVYDDHVGAGDRDMPYCTSDPRDGEFELATELDPEEILPDGHTSCIVRAEFLVVEGGVQVTFIIYSNTDGGRTFL